MSRLQEYHTRVNDFGDLFGVESTLITPVNCIVILA